MAETATVFIVYADDLPADVCRRAKLTASALKRPGTTTALINKLSSDVEELAVVARYRVLDVPGWLVVRDDTVVLRLSGIPTPREAQQLLDAIM